MRRTLTLGSLAAAAIVASALTGTTPAYADAGDATADLAPVALNGVDASGTAMVSVNGTRIDVTMAASGLLPDNPHAAHIHFGADARHECPAASDDADSSGTLNTTEGDPAYGPIVVSLTKTGDTSPKSGLAVERFDTAPGGNLSYERGSIKVSQKVAKAITNSQAVIVIHGVDHNDNGKYDGDTKSDLDPKLPTEATDPAICGVLVSAPTGGAATGFGGAASTSDDNNTAMMAVGGGLLLVAACGGTAAVARRRGRI